MQRFSILLTFLISLILNGQNEIKGIIYDNSTTVKGARIYNETQNNIEFSNNDGKFIIGAQVGDSLVLHSLFHNKLYLTVEEHHFKEIAVFELTKFTNELDAVEIVKREDKKFDNEETNELNEKQISQDLIDKHYLYEPAPNTNMNLLAIAGMIGKLFKGKNKEPEIAYASAEDLQTLFEKDSFFNQTLLLNDLKIKESKQFLFFEYCSAQNINTKLINDNKSINLLELLLKYSEEFNKIVESSIKN